MVMPAPTALTNSAVTQTTFTGSWTASAGAAGYNVLISSDGGTNNTYLATVTATTYAFTVSAPGTPLVQGSTYLWSVQAYGGDPAEYSDLASKSVTMASPAPAQSTAQVQVVRGGVLKTGTLQVVRGGVLT